MILADNVNDRRKAEATVLLLMLLSQLGIKRSNCVFKDAYKAYIMALAQKAADSW